MRGFDTITVVWLCRSKAGVYMFHEVQINMTMANTKCIRASSDCYLLVTYRSEERSIEKIVSLAGHSLLEGKVARRIHLGRDAHSFTALKAGDSAA